LFNVGPTELIVILLIALIVFGPKRLPEVGRTVGKSLREFRRASQDLRDELNLNLEDEDLPADRPAPGEPGHEKWRTTPLETTPEAPEALDGPPSAEGGNGSGPAGPGDGPQAPEPGSDRAP
jgi:TatA/E family protein of Tat protein translocase